MKNRISQWAKRCCADYLKNRSVYDSIVLFGTYRILADTLYLTSVEFPIQLANWLHKDTVDFEKERGYEWMKKKYSDVKFKITRCTDGQILLVAFYDNKFWYATKKRVIKIILCGLMTCGSVC